MSASRVISLVTALLGLAGVCISAYLTSVHYSSVLGIPWSVGGIAWFAVSGGLALMALVRRPEPSLLQPLQLAWSLLGLGVVIYLVGVEFVAVGHVCVWCSAMHGLIIATLLLTLLRTPPDPEDQRSSAPETGEA